MKLVGSHRVSPYTVSEGDCLSGACPRECQGKFQLALAAKPFCSFKKFMRWKDVKTEIAYRRFLVEPLDLVCGRVPVEIQKAREIARHLRAQTSNTICQVRFSIGSRSMPTFRGT